MCCKDDQKKLLCKCEKCILEIARQLCIEHEVRFFKMASFDDNSLFMIAMLRMRISTQDSSIYCSILELYIMVCMRRLEFKEQESYNFNSIMKEYKTIYDSVQNVDIYSRNVCLRAWNLHEPNSEIELVDEELSDFDENEVKRVTRIAFYAHKPHRCKDRQCCEWWQCFQEI
ncbi:putative origin recognition complex subunit 4 [Helianthus debilis subsp. tardiflorus]